MNKLVLIALISLLSFAAAENYSVLIAGSNGYENYRHQADVCHAYQVLIQKGFKAENIIVFSFNDVVNHKNNPFKGKLFNKPNGEDVYAGCKIDYEGSDVTPKNYMNVLLGNKEALANIGNGRVLESTKEDNVFLYFADHGAPGLIAFPSSVLYATELVSTLQTMFNTGKYAKLVYYLEACESGSMFINLPTDINVYALSAANPTQSSYAAYCGINARVKGKLIGSCLGDLFSINWMEQVDSIKDLSTLTLQEQFQVVAKKTSASQVMQWGDLSFTSEPVSDFLTASANTPKVKTTLMDSLKNFFHFAASSTQTLRKSHEFNEEHDLHKDESFIDSRKAKISYLIHSYTSSPSADNFEQLSIELHQDQKFQTHFDKIMVKVGGNETINGYATTNFECYKTLIDAFQAKCGKIPDSQLGGLRHFYEYCGRTFITGVNHVDLLNDLC